MSEILLVFPSREENERAGHAIRIGTMRNKRIFLCCESHTPAPSVVKISKHVLKMFWYEKGYNTREAPPVYSVKNPLPFNSEDVSLLFLCIFRPYFGTIMVFVQVSHVGVRLLFYILGRDLPDGRPCLLPDYYTDGNVSSQSMLLACLLCFCDISVLMQCARDRASHLFGTKKCTEKQSPLLSKLAWQVQLPGARLWFALLGKSWKHAEKKMAT